MEKPQTEFTVKASPIRTEIVDSGSHGLAEIEQERLSMRYELMHKKAEHALIQRMAGQVLANPNHLISQAANMMDDYTTRVSFRERIRITLEDY